MFLCNFTIMRKFRKTTLRNIFLINVWEEFVMSNKSLI
jgi:hypothetical protein